MPAPGPDPYSDLRKRIAVLEKHNAEFSLRISALMNELPEDKRGGYMWDKRDELETLKKRIAELKRELERIKRFDCCREAERAERYKRERDEARREAERLHSACGDRDPLPWGQD